MMKHKNNFWELMGKVSVVVVIIASILGIVTFFSNDSPSIKIDAKTNEYTQIPFSMIFDEFDFSIDYDSSNPNNRMSYRQFLHDYNMIIYLEAENNGKSTINNPQIKIGRECIYEIIYDNGDIITDSSKGMIPISNLMAGEKIEATIWLGYNYSNEDIIFMFENGKETIDIDTVKSFKNSFYTYLLIGMISILLLMSLITLNQMFNGNKE